MGFFLNEKPNGEQYYTDAYMKALFGNRGQHTGYLMLKQVASSMESDLAEIQKKNVYLEYAAKILRHDMHSGINIYIPRGISSLERKLSDDKMKKLNIYNSFKLIKEGLKHSQKVYQSIYEFTNLVKDNVSISKKMCDTRKILKVYLSGTIYASQVILDKSLPIIEINEALFCTAIDNLIRNGP